MKMFVETEDMYCKTCGEGRFHQIVHMDGLTITVCWACGTTRMKPEIFGKDLKSCVEYATRNMPAKARAKVKPRDIPDMDEEVQARFEKCVKDMEYALKSYFRKPIESYDDPFEETKPLAENPEELGKVAEEFEKYKFDNQPVPEMDFGAVIRAMKEDNTRRFARKGWNGKNMYLMLQRPTRTSKMTLPYIYMRTAQGDLVPWLASQTDMLAEDWHEVSQ